MLVRRFVMRYSPPIHSTGRGMGLGKARDHVAVPALSIGVFLAHECDPAQTSLKSTEKIGFRQIAFQSDALLTVAVEEKHRRRPHSFETVEPGRMFLDVRFDGEEILVDEVSGLIILV
jgi:hypothetical protein